VVDAPQFVYRRIRIIILMTERGGVLQYASVSTGGSESSF
jgi:hypothetical protein